MVLADGMASGHLQAQCYLPRLMLHEKDPDIDLLVPFILKPLSNSMAWRKTVSGNFIANALESRQYCIKPWNYSDTINRSDHVTYSPLMYRNASAACRPHTSCANSASWVYISFGRLFHSPHWCRFWLWCVTHTRETVEQSTSLARFCGRAQQPSLADPMAVGIFSLAVYIAPGQLHPGENAGPCATFPQVRTSPRMTP